MKSNSFRAEVEIKFFQSWSSSASLKAATWHEQPAKMTMQYLLLSCQPLFLSSFFFFLLKLQLEYTARLDFLWRVQAKEEINEMKELREHNENMLRNILPSHVARHFLEKDRDNEVGIGFMCDVFLYSTEEKQVI